jgi:hypothetical protein
VRRLIHVAQDAIRKNAKTGSADPPLILRVGGKATRHSTLVLRTKDGQELARFVYQPQTPLSCGARLWLEVAEGVVIDDCKDENPHCDGVFGKD